MAHSASADDRERRLDEAVAEYLRLQAAGQTPERHEWLANFPDLAAELGEFLNDVALVRAEMQADATGTQTRSFRHAANATSSGQVVADRYVLESKLGEGGMGEVWVARQTAPVKRRVAMKFIKLGMDSRAVLARFEAERQALAILDHPNIAKVLDGGLTRDGQPFFVMELVNGTPLTKFCDEAGLTLNQCLEMFVHVCMGVQHAHQKGIVHRDLKPSNILVTMIDGKPAPKIIDFGIAKATGGKLSDESLLTDFGAIVGTLEYMSPEQAGFCGQDVDTRSDIYSLGVLLYEMLTGVRPISSQRLQNAAFTEMIRLIKDEEPPRPSTCVSTDNSLPSLAALRHIEPHRLMSMLRGELDWIAMKCLEKDRNRRYATANGLAVDLQRFLAGEAVEARPPSSAYRLAKSMRRHRRTVASAGLLLVSLLGGFAGTSWALLRARSAEKDARQQSERAVAVSDFLTEDLLGQASPELNPRSEQVTVEQLLDRSAKSLDNKTALDQTPEVKAEILVVLAATYQALGKYSKAVEFWKRAIDLYQKSTDTLKSQRTLEATQGYGSALLDNGAYSQAEMVLLEVVQQRLAESGAEHTETLLSKNNLALAIAHQERIDEAEKLLREVLETRVRIFGSNRPETLQVASNLAGMLSEKGDFSQAEKLYRQAIEGYQSQAMIDSPNAMACENALITNLIRQRKLAEAKSLLMETIQRRVRVLGAQHSETLGSRTNLAYVLNEMGDADGSVREVQAVYDTAMQEYGPTYSETLTAKNTLVLALRGAQRWDEAIQQARELIELRKAAPKENGLTLMIATNNLGWVLEGKGDLEQAEQAYSESLRIAADNGLSDLPDSLSSGHNLARIFLREKRFSEAAEQAQKILVARKRVLPPNHPYILASSAILIESLIELGSFEESQQLLGELLESTRGPLPEVERATLLYLRGCILIKTKEYSKAIEPLQQALASREKSSRARWQVSQVRSALGEAWTGTRQFELASQALSLASQELAANPDSVPEYKTLVELNNERTVTLSLIKSDAKD